MPPSSIGGPIAPISSGFTSGTTKDAVLTDAEMIVSNVIGVLTILGGVFFVVYFLLATIKWITAGEASKASKARDQMVQGVLGLVVLIMAYGIVGLIGSVVGLRLLEPGTVLRSIAP